MGRLIDDFCFLKDEDVESWHRGVVLKTFGRKKIMVRYNDCSYVLYPQSLFEELKAENVRVVELKGQDVVGANIAHMFEDDESGENIWCNAEVLDLNLDSDPENPKFIFHDDEEKERQEKKEYYLERLDHCLNCLIRSRC